ncbi:MAG: CinA family protein [Promethearchaeota archaeon]
MILPIFSGFFLSSLMHRFFYKLKQEGIKLFLAESATGGLFSNLMTDISGSSSVLITDIVCYSAISKIKLLNVPENIIREHGTVSNETANALISGLIKISREMSLGNEGTTSSQSEFRRVLYIAITGIAGASIESKPSGLFYIGMAYKDGSFDDIQREVAEYELKGDRRRLKQIAVKKAIQGALQLIK